MNEKRAPEAREVVSRAYAKVVSVPAAQTCCGPGPKGTLARRAGYRDEEIAALPSEAVVNSFGCGNPLSYGEVCEGDVVLDLGSGAGIDVVLAARKVGPTGRAIGVDMTDQMIAKARAVIAEAGLTNAEIRKGLIEELPVETASVDWVISNCVINLSPEKSRVFAEIARVLKPGGRVLISNVIAEGLPPAVLEDLRFYSCCVAGALSEKEYRDGLARAGLVDVEIHQCLELSLPQVEALLESDRRAFERADRCGKEPGEAGVAACDLASACAGKVWAAEISARKPSS